MVSWSDQAQAYSAIISVPFLVAGVFYASWTFLAQKRATDVSNVLAVFERLDHHWCRYRSHIDDKGFEFGQLISYYELSCALFRHDAFNTKLSDVLRYHLYDVLVSMNSHVEFKQSFDELRSEPDTYENIQWLCAQPNRVSAKRDCLAFGLRRIYGSSTGRIIS